MLKPILKMITTVSALPQHLVVYLGLAAASQICIHVTRYYSIPEDGEYCF